MNGRFGIEAQVNKPGILKDPLGVGANGSIHERRSFKVRRDCAFGKGNRPAETIDLHFMVPVVRPKESAGSSDKKVQRLADTNQYQICCLRSQGRMRLMCLP